MYYYVPSKTSIVITPYLGYIDALIAKQRHGFRASGTDRITLVTCKTGKTKVEDLVTDPMRSEKRRKFCT